MNMANEPTNQEQPKKKSKLKLIIILLILLLLILGGVATYWWLNLRVPEPVNTEIPQQTQTAEAPAEKPKEENYPCGKREKISVNKIAPTKIY